MYTSVTIVYNPNSTGNAPRMAAELSTKIKKVLPDIPVHKLETEFAGHAEKLAYEAAKSGKEPLVISVSGDGGYHEVINGAMKAAEQGFQPICAVLAAGNANDHRRYVRKRPLLDAIATKEVSHLDLLKVSWKGSRRYAHSYVGIGLTPVVAVELNRHTLNSLKELLLVVKTYWKYQPLTVDINGKKYFLDSLVLANIAGMAKLLKLSEDGKPTDGKFEVVLLPHRHKLGMITWAIKAATAGLGKQPQVEQFEFTALEPMPMQLDGEVVKLKAKTHVSVSIAPRVLRTIR